MGLICCKDVNDPVTCVKCGDTFRLHFGGKSQRTSCRVHNWKLGYDRLGRVYSYCKTCHRTKKEISCRNCYHCYFRE